MLLVALLWTGVAWAAGGPLQVRRISPSGSDVPRTQEAVIQFDRAMVPLGHMGRKTATLPVKISPDPGCQWRWLNTSELACRLPKQKRFAPATHYTVTVQPGVSILSFEGGAWPNMSIVTGGFYHRETHFDAVRFFAGDLPAGHYVVEYSAQVIAPGSFIAPAPTIKEIYQPDVFGRGAAQHVTVAMPGH